MKIPNPKYKKENSKMTEKENNQKNDPFSQFNQKMDLIIQLLVQEKNEIKQENKKLKTENENLKSKIKSSIEENKKYKNLISNLKKIKNKNNFQINHDYLQIYSNNNAKLEIEQLKNKISKLRNVIINKREEISKLKFNINKIALYVDSKNSDLKSILNENNQFDNNSQENQSLMLSSDENQLIQGQYNSMVDSLKNFYEKRK